MNIHHLSPGARGTRLECEKCFGQVLKGAAHNSTVELCLKNFPASKPRSHSPGRDLAPGNSQILRSRRNLEEEKKKLWGGKIKPRCSCWENFISFNILCLCLDLSHFNQLLMTLPSTIRAAHSLHASFVFMNKIN